MNHSRPQHGFTLIELLVVISIIALLISILLPALGSAREAARASVCLGHLRGVGQGMAVYHTENDGWLPGPNTSGWDLTLNQPYNPSRDEPTSNFDWVSPVIGGSLGLPTDRVAKIEALFNEEFKCPSNSENYISQFGGPATTLSPNQLSTPSYLASRWFFFHSQANVPTGGIFQFTGDINVPGNYAPRIENVGQESSKAFGFDGTQYVSWAGNNVTDVNFDTRTRFASVGDSWMSNGPALSSYNGNPYRRSGGELLDAGLRYGFRHSSKSLNAVYFDGHGSALSSNDATDPRLSWPTGSTVASIVRLDDPHGLAVNATIP